MNRYEYVSGVGKKKKNSFNVHRITSNSKSRIYMKLIGMLSGISVVDVTPST